MSLMALNGGKHDDREELVKRARTLVANSVELVRQAKATTAASEELCRLAYDLAEETRIGWKRYEARRQSGLLQRQAA
jgi:hypothetical protein